RKEILHFTDGAKRPPAPRHVTPAAQGCAQPVHLQCQAGLARTPSQVPSDDPSHLVGLKSPGPRHFSSPSLSVESSRGLEAGSVSESRRQLPGDPGSALGWSFPDSLGGLHPGFSGQSNIGRGASTPSTTCTFTRSDWLFQERDPAVGHRGAPVPQRTSVHAFAVHAQQLYVDSREFQQLGLRPLIPQADSQHLEGSLETMGGTNGCHI
ncbi:hypothetical protein E2I00_016225, partial [Balaenoptera physalus]